jgi:hypothetical protein
VTWIAAVEHENFAEELLLEQHEVLVLRLRLVENALGLEHHTKAEIVKKRLGDPALGRH